MSLKYWIRKATCSSGVAPTLNYETDLLDSTIRRIIGLLQVGFGEAGAAIIAQNMKVCVTLYHLYGSLRERLLLSCVGDFVATHFIAQYAELLFTSHWFLDMCQIQ